MAKEKKEIEPYQPSRAISVFDQMDRLFEDFFGRRFGRWWPRVWFASKGRFIVS